MDSNLNVIPNGGYSNMVDFQTVLNSVNDNINTPIRELGLIGGGKTGGLDLGLKATPFFNSSSQDNINKTDTALLINYKTLPPLVLPAGINFIFSWVLTF